MARLSVTVGTWNVENLFPPGAPSGPVDQQVYQGKLTALASTIHNAAPDLLAVQEVGDPAAMADLVARLDGDWHTALSSLPDGRGIRVGFLSRLPLQPLADLADLPAELAPLQANDSGTVTTRMGRGALAVRVRTASGTELSLVCCHLKSKLLSFPAGAGRSRFHPRDEGERARYGAYALYRRAAEAVTVRDLADQLIAGQGRERAVIVLGDLNDELSAATTQILPGPPGSELDTGGAQRPDRGDGWRLWNLAPLIPAEQRWSRIYQGRPELIDHILVSHALHQQAKQVRTIGERDLVSIGDDPTGRRRARDSDHAPVLAELDI